MTSKRWQWSVFATLLGACGGGRGVDREVAQKACAHQIALGFWQGFERSFTKNGAELDAAARETGAKELAKLEGGAEYKATLEKCTDGFAKLGTPAAMDCVIAAKTSAAAQACLAP